MSDQTNESTNPILDLAAIGDYKPSDRLSFDEMSRLAARALDGFATMNGDTATVPVTVRQLSILLNGLFRGSLVWDEETMAKYDEFHPVTMLGEFRLLRKRVEEAERQLEQAQSLIAAAEVIEKRDGPAIDDEHHSEDCGFDGPGCDCGFTEFAALVKAVREYKKGGQ